MAYKSKYEEQLANALGKITNREKFNYDFNADPMYQMYKDQYTKLGNEAAANAAANVSALTGGYGNSYAATAAAQANQQYLTKLNEMVPTLQQQALNKYMMEGDELNNLYQTLSDADTRDYSKYRDNVADQQWQKSFDESNRQWQANYDYNKQRAAVADQQWQANYDYNKQRAAVADSQWQKNYDYNKERAKVSDEQWQKNYDYNAARAAVADEQWKQNFEEQIRQYNQNFTYNQSRDAVADSQWQAQFDENKRRYDQEWAASQAAQAAAQALLNSQSYSGGSSGGSGVKVIRNNGGGTTSTTKTATSTPKASVTVGTTGSTVASGNNIKSASPMLYDGTTTQTVKKATDTQNLEAIAAKNKAQADLKAYNKTVDSTANAIKQMMNNGTTEANINRTILSAIVSANDSGYIDMNKDAEKMEKAIRAKVNKLK